jgi:hypothetical protein
VIFSGAYQLMRCLLSALMLLTRCKTSRETELLVLRHENAVLRAESWDEAAPIAHARPFRANEESGVGVGAGLRVQTRPTREPLELDDHHPQASQLTSTNRSRSGSAGRRHRRAGGQPLLRVVTVRTALPLVSPWAFTRTMTW